MSKPYQSEDTLEERIRRKTQRFDFGELLKPQTATEPLPDGEELVEEGAKDPELALDPVQPEPAASVLAPVTPEQTPSADLPCRDLPEPAARYFVRTPWLERRWRRRLWTRSLRLAAIVVFCAAMTGAAWIGYTRYGPGRLLPVSASRKLSETDLVNGALGLRSLPNPGLTPGEYRPIRKIGTRLDVDLDAALRRAVFRLYGIRPGDPRFAIAPVIPPALGGTASARNAFPMPVELRDLKRRTDRAVLQAVRSDQLSLNAARSGLRQNWLTMAKRLRVVRNVR